MYTNLKSLLSLLSTQQRRRLILLQFLVIFMAFAEVAGVFAISPFIGLVADLDQIYSDSIIGQLYSFSGFTNPSNFVTAVGAGVLFLLTFAALMNIYTIWKFSMFAAQIGADLSNRLFVYYMAQPWLFHSEVNSSELVNKIVQECNRMSSLVITPILQLNARIVMALVMVIAIFIYNPGIAVMGTAIFVIAYFLLFLLARYQLDRNSTTISREQITRFKMMSEGFGGIKDTLLLGRQAEFNKAFTNASNKLAYAQGNNNTLSMFPKYLLELMAYSSVIFLILYLNLENGGRLEDTLPILAVFALAGFKLLPAINLCYVALSIVRGNMSSFEILRKDLLDSAGIEVQGFGDNETNLVSSEKLVKIELENISFTYPNSDNLTLKNINLNISVGSFIGVVGSSGSGKSTLMDIVLGLIEPAIGVIRINGKALDSSNLGAWQNNIGVVSQNIFLADSSIQENVAFGIPSEKVNKSFVLNAIKLANLDEFIETLPEGIDTKVGERGVQLSGGQRQRIGIARALYNDASVLVFDEATSSLDGITEKKVMDAIYNLSGQKTVIMVAHRLASVKKCSCIYLMHEGTIIDSGTFDGLAKRNKLFQDMTDLS
jgi:HlyD family secretion protein